MTKQEVIKFRSEFEKAVQSLEDQFGVSISLGTIRFDSQGLRGKMVATKGPKAIKATRDDFQVGDTVTINPINCSIASSVQLCSTCVNTCDSNSFQL